MTKNSQSPRLKLYRASAGSGKTYRLSLEFLKLLIHNPFCYDKILAVTFTNKATTEMQTRIMADLYSVAKGLDTGLINHLKKELNKEASENGQENHFSDQLIKNNAQKALFKILHDYSHFQISTIDSFFQIILRNLAHELGLGAYINIVIESDDVLSDAIDLMKENFRTNAILRDRINEYSNEKTENNTQWRIDKDMFTIGKNIFREVFMENEKELEEKLRDPLILEKFKKEIIKLKKFHEKRLSDMVLKFDKILEDNGLTVDDLSSKAGGAYAYINSIKRKDYEPLEAKKKAMSCLEAPEKWASQKHPRQKEIIDLGEKKLNPLLLETEDIRKESIVHIHSCNSIYKQLSLLGFVSEIADEVKNVNQQRGQFLLSDTPSLLKSMIEDDDTPFIYEKIGTHLEHIMIDEFQDTSTVQWKNFKVLMNECISHADSQNLIVGDVKQSIYRWRSGDWRLLNNISKEFNNNIFKEESLHTNYRSARNIIDFNNAFFSVASKLEYNQLVEKKVTDAESLLKAYGDVIQDTPSGRTKEGLVHIELLPKEDYKEKMMECIEGNIAELIENGVPANKIAILVRSNDTIKEIADYLMKKMPDVKLVSDEAFRIENSQAVQIIILALQFIAYPEDILNRASLVQAYNKYILDNELSNNYLIKNDINDEDTLLKFLPREFAENREELKSMPLADLIEYIYRVFNIKALKGESAYVCTFFDLTFKFMYETPTDVYTLLNEWNENMHKETIQSDEVDGVRLITIHKSKGLEFDNVIIPFCDWTLEKGGLIWCSPPKDISPFNQLPIIPVNYSEKQMKETIFQEEYNHEHLQNMVDNLNLLYVAFTRACKNLFIYGKRGDARYRSYIIEQSLPLIQQEHLEDCILKEDSEEKDSSVIFTYGTFAETKTQEEANESKNIFNKKETTIKLFVETFDNKTEFQQSNKSREYISENDDEEKQNTYIKIGNILHGLLASIHTIDDLDKAITQLENEGILETEDITIERIKNLLDKRMKNPTIIDWFSNRWNLYNECSILYIDPETNELMTRRPDRVMTNENETIVVDFKFGSQKSEHFSQVKDYMALLNNMNHKHVKGYLWYVYSNNIIEVK